MSYKYTQFFYICPRNAVRKESLSDNYRDSVWDTDYANPRNIRKYLDSDPWLKEYKYAAPREAGKVVTKKEILHRLFLSEKRGYLLIKIKHRLQRPLYKEDRVEKYRDSIAEYTLPKSFVEEHKYRDIRL